MTRIGRAWAVLAVTALVLGACGGGSEAADPTSATDSSNGSTTTAATGSSDDMTTTLTGPSGAGGAGEVVVIVGGVEYRLSVADDVAVGGTGTFFPTRCAPNSFGAGMFWVVATAVDESGARAEPNVNLSLSLPHDGQGTADMPPEFELFVASTAESPLQLDYVLATEDGLAGIGGPAFEGDLGSWTVDGNRVAGEVTVFEGDHLREFFTATFDVVCPAP
jgi:hypothetical protein